LEKLGYSFQGPNLRVKREGNFYYLQSTGFNILDVEHKVAIAAGEILDFNGFLKLNYHSTTPIVIDGIQKIDDDGKKTVYIHMSASFAVRDRLRMQVTVNGEELDKTNPNTFWIEVAKRDDKVAKVLRLIA
jgi:hypothetical protein